MRWLTVLIVLMLAGCASSQIQKAQDAARLQLGRDWAECDSLYPDKNRKPVTPRIKCQAAANGKLAAAWKRATGNAPSDMVIHEKNVAQALLAAERFDKGEISAAEYNLEIANSNLEAENQRFHRKAVAAKVDAARQEAAASTSAAIRAATQVRRPTTTNCNTFGSTVNCTAY